MHQKIACMSSSQSAQDRKQCLCQSLDTAVYISLFICSVTHAWIRSFMHPFIHACFHSFIHLLTKLPNHYEILKVVRANYSVLFPCSQQRASRATGRQHYLPGERCRSGQAGHDSAAHTAAPALPWRHMQTAASGDLFTPFLTCRL